MARRGSPFRPLTPGHACTPHFSCSAMPCSRATLSRPGRTGVLPQPAGWLESTPSYSRTASHPLLGPHNVLIRTPTLGLECCLEGRG